MAFEIASTNLVIELGVILALLMGWQFTLAEFIGGPIMIVMVAVLFRLCRAGHQLVEAARPAGRQGFAGSMEGHAAMDMSVQGDGSFLATTGIHRRGDLSLARVRHGVGGDIAGPCGRLAGRRRGRGMGTRYVLAALLFLDGHPVLSAIWGPIIGPLVAILTFVCSIGNVPLAVVLWNGASASAASSRSSSPTCSSSRSSTFTGSTTARKVMLASPHLLPRDGPCWLCR